MGAGIGLGDPGHFGALAFGEILGDLPHRMPGGLGFAGMLVCRARRPVPPGPAPAHLGLVTGQRLVVPSPAPLRIECLGGPDHCLMIESHLRVDHDDYLLGHRSPLTQKATGASPSPTGRSGQALM